MPNELSLSSILIAVLATYLLHSTVFLVGAWLLLAVSRIRSAAFQERVWKVAAIAPLLTAPLQFAGAERFNATAVWTLPALSFPEILGTPPAPKENSPTPLAVSPPHVAPLSNPDSPPPPADDAALVEIVPQPKVRVEIGTEPLPTTEPGASEIDLIPVVIEPAPRQSPEEYSAAAIEPAYVSPPSIVPPVDIGPPHNAATSPTSARVAGAGLSAAKEAPELRAQTSLNITNDWRIRVSLGATAVTLVGLICLMWRAAAGRWRLRTTQTITDGALRSSLDRLLRERGVRRRVRLACSATTSEPSAGGILRWIIVVPPEIELQLTPSEQHALLAHELAHLVRRDPLWLWIGTALCWCLPFQPLNFLAVRRWRQPAEELCDDWAIAGGVKPLTLANCLTRVAEWRFSPMPVGLTADIGKSRFARRISRLVDHESSRDHWSRPARQRLLFAGALTCSLVLTICGPRMQAASSPSGEPAGISPRINPNNPLPTAPDKGVAGAGLSAAKEAPELIDTALPAPTVDVQTELAALLSDLERLESLIGDSADDPELESARSGLRSRIDAIKTRITTSK